MSAAPTPAPSPAFDLSMPRLVRDPPLLATHKIVFVGDGGVGKTTFLKLHQTGEFEKKYIATMGVDVTPLPFSTNKGDLTLNIWDCAGQEKFSGMHHEYWVESKAAVVFFDVTSRVSYKNARSWIAELRAKMGAEYPIVLVGNKVDCKDRRVRPRDITLHRETGCIAYYDISAKSNYNFEKPFLAILRHLHGPDTNFAEVPVVGLECDEEAPDTDEETF